MNAYDLDKTSLPVQRGLILRIAIAASVCAIVTIFATLALLAFNIWSAGQSRVELRDHILEAFAAGDLGSEVHLRTNNRQGAHQFNDCLILAQALDDRGSALERGFAPTPPAGVAAGTINPCNYLETLAFEPDVAAEMGLGRYHRYLHGHTAVAALAVSALPLRTVRLVLDAASFFAVAGLICASALVGRHEFRKHGSKGIDTFRARSAATIGGTALVLLLFFGLQFFGMSLSHFPADIWLYTYLWLALFMDFSRWQEYQIAAYHALFGVMTAYFEFLSGGIPLGVCLIFLVFSAYGVGAGSGRAVSAAAVAVLSFMAGVVGAFVLKIATSVVIFGPSLIDDFMESLSYRVAGDSGNYLDLLVALLASAHYLGAGWRWLGASLIFATLAAFAYAVVQWRRRGRSSDDVQLFLLACAFASVIGWFLVFKQHTIQHNFFMIRVFVGAISSAALLTYFVSAPAISKRAPAKPENI